MYAFLYFLRSLGAGCNRTDMCRQPQEQDVFIFACAYGPGERDVYISGCSHICGEQDVHILHPPMFLGSRMYAFLCFWRPEEQIVCFLVVFPQTVLTVGVLTVLDKRGLDSGGVPFAVPGDSFLCAGCGNGEGHVAPVYAKPSVAPVYAVKHNDFGRFSLKILS